MSGEMQRLRNIVVQEQALRLEAVAEWQRMHLENARLKRELNVARGELQAKSEELDTACRALKRAALPSGALTGEPGEKPLGNPAVNAFSRSIGRTTRRALELLRIIERVG